MPTPKRDIKDSVFTFLSEYPPIHTSPAKNANINRDRTTGSPAWTLAEGPLCCLWKVGCQFFNEEMRWGILFFLMLWHGPAPFRSLMLGP